MESNKESHISLFLNIDIGKNITGIEHSSALRAKMFSYYDISKTLIMTIKSNNLVHYHIKSHTRFKNLAFCSLWHEYLGFKNIEKNLKQKIQKNKQSLITRLNNKHKNHISKVKYTDDNIDYISYTKEQKIGYKYKINIDLSIFSIEEFKNNKHVSTVYLNNLESPIIFEKLNYIKGKYKNSQFFFVDNKDRKSNRLIGDIDEMNYLLLSNYIENLDYNFIYLFIDKNISYHKASLKIRKDYFDHNSKQIRIINIIHSTHYIGLYKDDIIKKHYEEIFKKGNIRSDAIVCLTKQQSIDLKNRYPDSKIFVIPHSLSNTNQNVIASVKSNNKIVVYVARLSNEKNHIEAINIFNIVIKKIPNATLHIYGEGKEKDRINKHIDKLGLSKNIKVLGYVDNVNEIYKDAKISILTSKIEGFCLSLLESISLGCPAIAYDINYGPSEIIKNGINGFLIRPDDKSNFADNIINLLSNDTLRLRLSKNATYHYYNNFSSEKIAQKWVTLLGNIKNENALFINKGDITYKNRFSNSVLLKNILDGNSLNRNQINLKIWIFKKYITVIDIYFKDINIAIDIKFLQNRAIFLLFGRNKQSKELLSNNKHFNKYKFDTNTNKYIINTTNYVNVNNLAKYTNKLLLDLAHKLLLK